MFKQKSKLLSFIFIMIFSFFACSSSSDGGSGPDNDDVTAPRVISAEISNSSQTSIILIFDEKVKIDDTTGFSVNTMPNKASVQMTGEVEGSGTSTIYLALSRSVIYREIAAISYDGTGNVRDMSGNKLLSFTNMLLLQAESKSRFLKATVENLTPYKVDVEFTEPVVVNDQSGFSITINGSGATIFYVSSGSGSNIITDTGSGSDIITCTGSGSDVITCTGSGSNILSFTLYHLVVWGDDVTIEYDADMGGNLQDLYGNALASFGPETVINNVAEDEVPPEFAYAVVTDFIHNWIGIYFSEPILNPSAAGFNIYLDGVPVEDIGYAMSLDTNFIVLQFYPEAQYGQDITIEYDDGIGSITDMGNNPLGSFGPSTVSNYIMSLSPF
ncbi:MAG: hypothetical protein MUC95_00265 [Spirochaetes bacterium]|nr:hypothetical protein [Spirochaetota bacterium]